MITLYEKQCDICNRILSAQTKAAVEFNFKLHYDACKRKQKQKRGN